MHISNALICHNIKPRRQPKKSKSGPIFQIPCWQGIAAGQTAGDVRNVTCICLWNTDKNNPIISLVAQYRVVGEAQEMSA
jgi:hypothetical protein